jgi:hypothetical protein
MRCQGSILNNSVLLFYTNLQYCFHGICKKVAIVHSIKIDQCPLSP